MSEIILYVPSYCKMDKQFCGNWLVPEDKMDKRSCRGCPFNSF